MSENWLIKEDANDWECGWKDSEHFQLQYFKALPFIDKCRAVENMCQTARYFQNRRNLKKTTTPKKG